MEVAHLDEKHWVVFDGPTKAGSIVYVKVTVTDDNNNKKDSDAGL